MPKAVLMPALGLAQETGLLLQWFKAPGQAVTQGEPLMEIETDKATVEIEAPATGTLANVTAQPGDIVPVGQTIALILAPGEPAPEMSAAPTSTGSPQADLRFSPVAARMAAEHHLDLTQIKPHGGRVEKQDVLAYLAAQSSIPNLQSPLSSLQPPGSRPLASPKARRLAQEQGLSLAAIPGSGPHGAVLAADVLAASTPISNLQSPTSSRLWRRMAERLTHAWTTIPHFYLQRDVNAAPLAAWRAEAQTRATEKITYTDLLLKLLAAALTQHPRLNATWQGDDLIAHPTVNLGLAVAVDDGLLVPVIHNAAALGLSHIAARRAALVAQAQAGKLTPADLDGGTFTLTNLGMYGVDRFQAIVNPPQVAILAVGAVADRIVAVNGQPAVQPTLTLSLSCDHRAVDGARAAQFLHTLTQLIEAPLRLLE